MFWSIFFNSLILIIGVLAVGWIVASVFKRRAQK